MPKPCRLLDVGCGAGFPGIPLKIERPDLEVVLLDSRLKKIQFCETVIRELKLENIRAVQGRAEDPKIKKDLGEFDVVISRATTSIEKFLALAENYLKTGGVVIAMKGPDWEKECSPQEKWILCGVKDYELKNNMGKRALLLFRSSAG